MMVIVGIGHKILSETNYPKYLFYKFYKDLPSGKFKFYYTTDKSIKADVQAQKMAEICHHGYSFSIARYASNVANELLWALEGLIER
jgi:hypothetical protein